MARTKTLNICVRYGGTPLVINDRGPDKSPRFELYDTEEKKIVASSDQPLNFDEIIRKAVNES